MKAQFDCSAGQMTWTMPAEVATVLRTLQPEDRAKILASFGSNMQTLAGAMLSGFGNPAKIETINYLMIELHQIATTEIART